MTVGATRVKLVDDGYTRAASFWPVSSCAQ